MSIFSYGNATLTRAVCTETSISEDKMAHGGFEAAGSGSRRGVRYVGKRLYNTQGEPAESWATIMPVFHFECHVSDILL